MPNEQTTAIKLSDSDIKKFRDLWLEKVGIEIDKQEATKKLLLLVRQMEIIHKLPPTSLEVSHDN